MPQGMPIVDPVDVVDVVDAIDTKKQAKLNTSRKGENNNGYAAKVVPEILSHILRMDHGHLPQKLTYFVG